MIGKIQIKGLNELDKALAGLEDKAKDKVLSRALSRAIAPMQKDAKRYASIAPEPHTMTIAGKRRVKVLPGLLRSAIRRRKVPKREMAQLGGKGVAMGLYVGRGTKQKHYPNYWHFIEYGTSKQPAAPFLRPAFDKNASDAVKIFANTLKNELDNI